MTPLPTTGDREPGTKEERADRCETCRFYANVDNEMSGLADCRRYPPVMVPVTEQHDRTWLVKYSLYKPNDGGWPLVWPEDWCGEWQPKPLPKRPTHIACIVCGKQMKVGKLGNLRGGGVTTNRRFCSDACNKERTRMRKGKRP